MAANSELIRSNSLPPTLELRVATGKAAETLAIFLATNDLPDDSADNLRWAAGLLRLTADEPLKAGRSIGAYKRDVSLLAAAKRTKTHDQVKEVAETLAATRKTLDRLASGQHVSNAQVKSAFDALETIRSSLAAHRSSSTERIVRGRLRS
jgi:hypothetical protein